MGIKGNEKKRKMASLPSEYQRLMVHKLSTNFREAVEIETAPMCQGPEKGDVCIKTKYVGINASDVNMSKGRYFVSGKVPFGVGAEGVGEVVAVGEGVENVKVGQKVAFLNARCTTFAEYVCVTADELFAIPKYSAEYLALLVNGLTAALSLDKSARIVSGETVLITAAAGGTGHIAVQWAKAAGCHVIGTCSNEEKVEMLKSLGCDRVINYRTENLAEVLTKEYPKGIDVVWETIGGEVFETCLKSLAHKGRLVVVGAISGYKSEDENAVPKLNLSYLPTLLLMKNAGVVGFFLPGYKESFSTYFKYLAESLFSEKLKIIIDNGKKSTGEEFLGMEGIIRGVEHLHSGKNIGKVIARIS